MLGVDGGNHEHVLIISAGGYLKQNYITSWENLRPTITYIVYPEGIKTDFETDSDYLKKEKPRIRSAIRETHEEGGRHSSEVVDMPVPNEGMDAICDAVLSIKKRHPNARMSFNISSGTTQQITSLLIMAIWLGSPVYLISPSFSRVPIPEMHLTDLTNRQKNIVRFLHEGEERGSTLSDISRNLGVDIGRGTSNKNALIDDLDKLHAECRDNAGELQRGMGLVDSNGIGRLRRYFLTENGEFARKLLSICRE